MQHIYITSDHACYDLKEKISFELSKNKNFIITNLAPFNNNSCDYPDYANILVNEMKNLYMETFGIVICGTGIGMSIACNRHKHIRCALCYNNIAAEYTRKHNNSNVIALGSKFVDLSTSNSFINAVNVLLIMKNGFPLSS